MRLKIHKDKIGFFEDTYYGNLFRTWVLRIGKKISVERYWNKMRFESLTFCKHIQILRNSGDKTIL